MSFKECSIEISKGMDENIRKFENSGIVDALNKIKEKNNDDFRSINWDNKNRAIVFSYFDNRSKNDRFIEFYLDEKTEEPVLKLQIQEDVLINTFVTTINITDITKNRIDECLEKAMRINKYGSSVSNRSKVHNGYQKLTQEEFLNPF